MGGQVASTLNYGLYLPSVYAEQLMAWLTKHAAANKLGTVMLFVLLAP